MSYQQSTPAELNLAEAGQAHPPAVPQRPGPHPLPPAVDQLLRAQPDIFQAIWNSSSDAMVLSDADGIVLAANPAYFRLYGFPVDAVIGQSFALIFPPEQRAWAAEQYQVAFASPAIIPAYESSIRRLDGAERMVESRIDFLTTDGRRVAMLSTIRDITERKQAEAERSRLLEAEQQARAGAQRALQVRDLFLSIASHELKTPLTAVLGNVQLLQRRAQPGYAVTERDQQALRVVADQVRRLNQLIVDLLDVSRLETGQLHINCAPVDLAALTRRVVDELQVALDTQTITYGDTGEALVVAGDELRLEQVLYNLLGNALKYSPADGHVSVRVERRHEWACVAVADRGIGIPPEALPQLFDRFYRAENADGQNARGIGLGLYVVKEIITLHEGRVEVESTEGQGSTFTVCLPLHEVETDLKNGKA